MFNTQSNDETSTAHHDKSNPFFTPYAQKMLEIYSQAEKNLHSFGRLFCCFYNEIYVFFM